MEHGRSELAGGLRCLSDWSGAKRRMWCGEGGFKKGMGKSLDFFLRAMRSHGRVWSKGVA